ncbi:hypothetical protein [Sodalis sp. RH16]|uniref:hypothetical protein n=1 Tax=unclassified Sodalis (in: enterobacteria) TaxID=2636512 RepID=UPI0039B6069C
MSSILTFDEGNCISQGGEEKNMSDGNDRKIFLFRQWPSNLRKAVNICQINNRANAFTAEKLIIAKEACPAAAIP